MRRVGEEVKRDLKVELRKVGDRLGGRVEAGGKAVGEVEDRRRPRGRQIFDGYPGNITETQVKLSGGEIRY